MSTAAINLQAVNHPTPTPRLMLVKPLVESPDNAHASVAGSDDPDDEGAPLAKAVAELNHYVAGTRTDLRFTVDRDQGQLVVTIVDSETGQVLRQMPSVEALRIARYIEHDRHGLIRQQA